MRALIVAGSPTVDSRHVAALAASADLVIAADSGARACLEADVTPAFVVGDMDSVDAVTLGVLERRGADLVRHPADKDATDLDLAVDVGRERGCTRLVFTGISGGRADHEIAALGAVARAHDLEPVVEDAGVSGWTLSRTGRRTLRLAGPGATVSIFAFGRRARVRSSGLCWPLEGLRLEPLSSLGVSNSIVSAPATIEWQMGLVLVLSPQVGEVPPAREHLGA